jgi:phosphoesterase RecJ-like protein
LVQKIKDPILQGTTITEVHVSPDLSVAKIYFPALDQDQEGRIRRGFERAAPFLRRHLGTKLRLKKTPELRFLRDEAMEEGVRIENIIQEIKAESQVQTVAGTAALLEGAERFLITSHLNPDGDAVGSMLALMHLLRDNGKQVTVYHPDPVPGPYRFLAGADEIVADSDMPGEFDLFVVLDVAEPQRVSQKLPPGVKAAKMLVIDHHPPVGDYGDFVWRWPAAAVGQMVAQLGRHLDWKISPEFAECAYTAVLADTGSFRYSSTSSLCLETASWLVERGAKPWKVASNVYESWPVRRLQLLGDVLGTLSISCEGRLASLVVSQEALAARQASVDMTEGFVNEGRKIEGVEVSALFRELAPDQFRISFRSRGRVDVGTIATHLGGGGHRNASGVTAKGDLSTIRGQVEQLVAAALVPLDPTDQSCWTRP